MRNYSGALVDLVVFILGVVNDSFEKWKKTEYNEEIEAAAKEFAGAIGSGTTEDMKDALQSLIFALFHQKRVGGKDKYSSAVFSFLILYAFCKEGNLNRCNTFSQYFSRLIWFGRVSIYNTIKEEAQAEGLGFFECVPSLSSEMMYVIDTAPIASTRGTSRSS